MRKLLLILSLLACVVFAQAQSGNAKALVVPPTLVGEPGTSYVVYNDLLGQSSAARLPASNAPAWTDITIDGITLKALAFETSDYADFFFQTPHDVKLNTVIEAHVHWTMDADDDGDEIQWQITGLAGGIGAAFTAIDTLKSGDIVLSGNGDVHNYSDVGDIPAFNTTVSTCFNLRLERIAPDDGTDSAELIYLVFFDCHAQRDQLGSRTETVK